MMVRNDSADLHLYRFNGKTGWDTVGKVGNGWNFSHYFVGNWI